MPPGLARAPSNFTGARTGMSAGNRTGSVPPGPGTSLQEERGPRPSREHPSLGLHSSQAMMAWRSNDFVEH